MSKNLYFEDVDIGDEIGPIVRSVSDDDVIQFVSIREKTVAPSRFTSKEFANIKDTEVHYVELASIYQNGLFPK